MTDTGQIPGEGMPENAGVVEQPGIPGAYTFQDPSETHSEEDDLLLMPGAQGAWSDPQSVPATPAHHGATGHAPAPVAEQFATPAHRMPQASMAEHYASDQPMAEYGSAPQAGGAFAAPTDLGSPGFDAPADPGTPGFSGAPDHAVTGIQPAAGPGQGLGPVASAQQSALAENFQAAFGGEPAAGLYEAAENGQGNAHDSTREAASRDAAAHEAAAQTAVHEAAARAAVEHETGAHEAGGRHSGSVDLRGVRIPPSSATPTPPPARRPLHMGPPMPDTSGGVVRSLADRGPAGMPPHPLTVQSNPGPATTGPEYLDIPRDENGAPLPGPQLGEIPPQAGAPWNPQPQVPQPQAPQLRTPDPVPAETVVPEPSPVTADASVTPVETEAPVAEMPVTEAPAAEMPVPEAPVTEMPVAETPVPEQETEQQPEALPEPAPEQSSEGHFVPVEGSLPDDQHLAPTPVAVVPEQAAEPEPVAAPEVVVEEPVSASPEALHEAPEAEAGPVSVPAQAEPVDEVPSAEPMAAIEHPAEPEAEVEADAGVMVPAPREASEHVVVQHAEEVTDAAPEPEPLPEPDAEAVQESQPMSVQDPAAEPVPEETLPVTGPEPVAADNGPAPGYDDAEREAVLRVMRERRDIRNGFRSDPIPHEVLLRVLEAAHTAPSVGHSQPWDFVVIRSAETRRSMHELAQRQREAYAKSLPKGRAKQFKELKIEAILDTPVNIVVTADPTRGGRHTLGRHTQPQMAPYSSALAVENLWLAARAEGLGVGWVSFFDEREMVRALGLPEHLEVVAYLCVGYVDEFPEEPELMQAGWSKRRPLSWVVHEETYGRRALPGEDPHDLLQETVTNIRPLDAKALGEAWERQKRMTKPAGALGMLEIISAQLSGLSRMCPPPIPEPAAVAIFAGDHGVHAQGVTAWPQEVTGQMVANFLGGGAVCNAFANQVGAEVCVVDVGVASDLPATPGLLPRKVRAGTADFTTGPALTREEVLAAVEVGIETARDLVAAGNKALLTGEMGIANTTVSAALISVYTGIDPGEITGRGTGINDEMHARKVDVVRRALDLHAPDPADPIGVLSAVGGLEHAALVGFILGGASLRTPVVLDGVSAGAAALVARAVAPEALAACIAGHRSAEPGHVAALNKLGLRPLVDLDLRLGEGTGALLALPVVQSAARAMHEVATFDSAGVTEK
ncbi:nicotinate-nucleotide--dimethylbenzimidazole phosphoribosyltransferase [Streptomyces sp. NPDC008141]|uniref:nicotinate-nucleotide--dimethylbenzimidazole phosphoribosyltransferase n=1 Tax=Streptomyces sp. NPDC008141 TaxID=3364815 RepID=UPI0036E50EBE